MIRLLVGHDIACGSGTFATRMAEKNVNMKKRNIEIGKTQKWLTKKSNNKLDTEYLVFQKMRSLSDPNTRLRNQEPDRDYPNFVNRVNYPVLAIGYWIIRIFLNTPTESDIFSILNNLPTAILEFLILFRSSFISLHII